MKSKSNSLQLLITPEQKEEILNYFNEINLSKVCREVGVPRAFITNVLNNKSAVSSRYDLFAKVVEIAKSSYDSKKAAIEQIHSLLSKNK